MRTVMGYLLDMLPYMLFAAPLYLLGRWAYRKLRRRKPPVNWHHEAGLFLFALFLTGLASQTIIPKLEFTVEGVSLMGYSWPPRVNLVPFRILFDSARELFHGNAQYVLISFLGNIGIFVPVGFFLALLWRNKRLVRALFGGAGISLFIELCQLPMNRAVDIDDLLLNTFGAFCGYAVFRLLQKLAPLFAGHFAEATD